MASDDELKQPTASDSGHAVSKPLPVQLRSDLVVSRQNVRGEPNWAIKDPVALNYFHFGQREWFLLQQFDGKSSLPEISRRFQREFPPLVLGEAELLTFVRRVHADGLVILNVAGQGQQIFQRASRLRQQQRFGRFLSILAIRFRGIDPHRLLGFLSPIGSLLFHPLTFCLALMLGVATLALMLLQADVVSEKLPELSWFMQGDNLLWMMVAMSVVKVLHEFGHGLACRHYGGECHEMGLMFLVFSPCLYCNVSDSWMLPNRWQRIVISAAGIYVELILASICSLAWYFTHPGILNSVLLNVVFICSVNTLFLNGNPLLRYDGYYILSDLIDVPNLAAQSREAFWKPLRELFTLSASEQPRRSPIRWGLASYAIASMLYRVVVVSTIIWIIHSTMKQWELQAVGHLLIGVVLLGLVLPLVNRVRLLMRAPGELKMVRWLRLGIAMAVLGTAVVVLLLYPFPSRVSAPIAVEPGSAFHLYAPDDGWLVWEKQPGATIAEGETLCLVENHGLDRERQRIDDSIRELEVRVNTLSQRLADEPRVAIEMATAESELAEQVSRRSELQVDLDRLIVVSSQRGKLLPPPMEKTETASQRRLVNWQGTPLDAENEGCFVERGELLALVAQPNQLRVVMYVTQHEIDRVKVGQRTRIRLDQHPSQVLDGEVVSISEEELQASRQAYAASSELGKQPDVEMGERPLETSFRVTIALEKQPEQLIIGSGGRGRIQAKPISWGSRLLRYLRRTIRFEL